jgi:hypothetical protein
MIAILLNMMKKHWTLIALYIKKKKIGFLGTRPEMEN